VLPDRPPRTSHGITAGKCLGVAKSSRDRPAANTNPGRATCSAGADKRPATRAARRSQKGITAQRAGLGGSGLSQVEVEPPDHGNPLFAEEDHAVEPDAQAQRS
jgi:hypothetical protein